MSLGALASRQHFGVLIVIPFTLGMFWVTLQGVCFGAFSLCYGGLVLGSMVLGDCWSFILVPFSHAWQVVTQLYGFGQLLGCFNVFFLRHGGVSRQFLFFGSTMAMDKQMSMVLVLYMLMLSFLSTGNQVLVCGCLMGLLY